MTTHTFYLSGMHCQACERLVEMELLTAPGVTAAKASLRNRAAEVTGAFDDKPAEQLARELGPFVQAHGYTLSVTPPKHEVRWREFTVAVPVAAGLVLAFLFAQKLGFASRVGSPSSGYGMAFVIGVVASVSSCLAVVGGLVLSVSAYYAQRGERIRPQLLFHAGRLGGFFVLGGITGAAGSVFLPGATGTFALGLLVGVVMIVMGAGLMGIHPWVHRLQVTLPQSVGQHVQALKSQPTGLVPCLLGAATFFLPCGFTQSMQLYTLTTGKFLAGALTMLVFALGTLPMLALLSFSPLGARTSARSGVFFKTAGLIVIFFGLYNIFNSLVAYGMLPPIF